jgi:hypothetical protein
MRDVAEIIIPWVFVTLGLFVLLDWDESRLSGDALENAWPPATRTLALVYFGMLSLPVHFWRTRVRWRLERLGVGGLVLKVAARAFFIPAALVVALALSGVNWLLGEAIDALPDASLAWVMLASLGGFTGLMIWRSRKVRWWYHSARGH